MSEAKKADIAVGMGATTGFNGDSYPYTVIAVLSPKKIVVQADDYKVLEKDAMYKEGSLECEFSRNPNGQTRTLTLRKNGRWVGAGEGMRAGFGWYIGERAYSRNPHF